MATTDYEAAYAALQLNFGAGLKDVNKRWRKLSRIHHPDRHMRDPNAYRQALEKQKQLNNARDVLKKWFEANPNSVPPKTPRTSTQNCTQGNSPGSKSASGQSRSTSSRSQQTSGHSSGSRHESDSNQYHWDHRNQSSDGTWSSPNESTARATTEWFKTTDLNLTQLQQWVKNIDAYCNRPNSDSATGVAMALGFAAVFAPLWIITSSLGLIFPELPGHYPDWLTPILLFGCGYVTTYLFRWYFAETEIIKLQEQPRFFRSDRTTQNSVEYLKLVIGKQTRPNSQWKFVSTGTMQEAILEFDEEVIPEVKRSRKVVLRFEARQSTLGAIVGLEMRATSPVNSFSCKRLADSILVELKKDFHEVAA